MSAETKQFIEESRSNRDGGAAGAPRGPVALPPGWGNQSAGASASFGSFGRVKNEDEQNKWPRQQMKQNEPHGRSNKSNNVKREQDGEGERTPAWLKEVKSAVGVSKNEDQQQLAEQLQLHPSLLKAAPLRRGKMVAVVVDFDLSTRTGEISSEDIKATLRTVKTVAFSGPAMNKAEKHGEGMKDFFIGDKVLFDRLIFDDKGNPKAMGVEKFVEARKNATTRSTVDAQPAQRNTAHESTSSRARDREQVAAPAPTRGAASGAAASSSGPSAGEKPARKPMAAIRFNDLPVEKKFPGYVGKQLSAGTTPSTYSGASGVQLKRGPRSANDGTDTTNQRDLHKHQHEHQNLGPSGRVRDIARVVKWYEKKGYGYIESDLLYNQFNGQVFVHCHDLDNPEEEMREGDEVYYGKLAFNDRQQPFATGVRLVHARAARAKTSVFFSNVEFRKSEADLMDFFLQNCGLISHFKLFLDPVGRSRGQGVVRFADEVGYDKALALHDTRVSSGDTRLICIEPSRFAIPIGASDGVDAISVGMEEDRDDHDNAEDNGAAEERCFVFPGSVCAVLVVVRGGHVSPDLLRNMLFAFLTGARRLLSAAAEQLLSAKMRKNLGKHGFLPLTDVQSRTIAPVLRGLDVMATAPPGSGKTVAFLAPVLDREELALGEGVHEAVLWISPTRELAAQTWAEAMKLKHSGQRAGGGRQDVLEQDEFRYAKRALREGHDVVIATPHCLAAMKEVFRPAQCRILVVDEADQCFSREYAEQMQVVFEDVLQLSRPVEAKGGNNKPETPEHCQRKAIIFLPTRTECALLAHEFAERGPSPLVDVDQSIDSSPSPIHWVGRQLSAACSSTQERKATVDAFKRGDFPVLFCTDVAARGLDVSDVALVVHVPQFAKGGRGRGWRMVGSSSSGTAAALQASVLAGEDIFSAGARVASGNTAGIEQQQEQFKSEPVVAGGENECSWSYRAVPWISRETYTHRAGRIRGTGASVVLYACGSTSQREIEQAGAEFSQEKQQRGRVMKVENVAARFSRRFGLAFREMDGRPPSGEEVRLRRLKRLARGCAEGIGLDTEAIRKALLDLVEDDGTKKSIVRRRAPFSTSTSQSQARQRSLSSELLARALCVLEATTSGSSTPSAFAATLSSSAASPLSGRANFVPVLFRNCYAEHDRAGRGGRVRLLALVRRELERHSKSGDYVRRILGRVGRVALTTDGYAVDVPLKDAPTFLKLRSLKPDCAFGTLAPIVENEKAFLVRRQWRRRFEEVATRQGGRQTMKLTACSDSGWGVVGGIGSAARKRLSSAVCASAASVPSAAAFARSTKDQNTGEGARCGTATRTGVLPF
eukprot:g853.t1